MDTHSENELKTNSRSTYIISIRGTLPHHWEDWFNGKLIKIEQNTENSSHTKLTCQVRDQAELIGIINWLHNMNLTLVSVSAVQKEHQAKKI